MKLKKIDHIVAYRFNLTFADGITKESDLKELIGKYVMMDAVNTARVNTEWGCLEFNNGMVDIEPVTLYKYVIGNRYEAVA